jgi:hypothetical protein
MVTQSLYASGTDGGLNLGANQTTGHMLIGQAQTTGRVDIGVEPTRSGKIQIGHSSGTHTLELNGSDVTIGEGTTTGLTKIGCNVTSGNIRIGNNDVPGNVFLSDIFIGTSNASNQKTNLYGSSVSAISGGSININAQTGRVNVNAGTHVTLEAEYVNLLSKGQYGTEIRSDKDGIDLVTYRDGASANNINLSTHSTDDVIINNISMRPISSNFIPQLAGTSGTNFTGGTFQGQYFRWGPTWVINIYCSWGGKGTAAGDFRIYNLPVTFPTTTSSLVTFETLATIDSKAWAGVTGSDVLSVHAVKGTSELKARLNGSTAIQCSNILAAGSLRLTITVIEA